ncbi:hypothetical protein FQZ97_1196020 [compost metagenome]
MAFERHGLEAFGHVGFINAVQVHRRLVLLEHLLHGAPHVGAGRVGQVGQRMGHRARQREQRFTLFVGLDKGRQRFAAQRQHLVARGVELDGL